MGRYLSVILGSLGIIVGVILLVFYVGDILTIIRGVMPGLIILAGSVSLAAGIAEIKDRKKNNG